MGKFRQISAELWPLIDDRDLFFRSLPLTFFTDFLQTSHET